VPITITSADHSRAADRIPSPMSTVAVANPPA
jgi:hypothetical protein